MTGIAQSATVAAVGEGSGAARPMLPPKSGIVHENEFGDRIDKIVAERRFGDVDEIAARLGIRLFDPGAGSGLLGHFSGGSKARAFMFAFVMLAISSLPAALAIIQGSFSNAALAQDFSSDWGYWIQAELGPPLVTFSLVQFMSFLPRVLLCLCLSGTVCMSVPHLREFNDWANRVYSRPFIVYSPAIIAAIATFLMARNEFVANAPSWYVPTKGSWGSLAGWAGFGVIYLAFYLTMVIVFRVVATCAVLKRLFASPLNIQALHPDGSGGLYPVGWLFMKLTPAVVAVGVCCAIMVVFGVTGFGWPLYHPVNVIVICAYITGATLVVFLPLVMIHRRMAQVKYADMEALNRAYEDRKGKLYAALRGASPVEARVASELETLRKEHEAAKVVPVWPFNTTMLLRFEFYVLLPLASAIIVDILKRSLMHIFG